MLFIVVPPLTIHWESAFFLSICRRRHRRVRLTCRFDNLSTSTHTTPSQPKFPQTLCASRCLMANVHAAIYRSVVTLTPFIYIYHRIWSASVWLMLVAAAAAVCTTSQHCHWMMSVSRNLCVFFSSVQFSSVCVCVHSASAGRHISAHCCRTLVQFHVEYSYSIVFLQWWNVHRAPVSALVGSLGVCVCGGSSLFCLISFFRVFFHPLVCTRSVSMRLFIYYWFIISFFSEHPFTCTHTHTIRIQIKFGQHSPVTPYRAVLAQRKINKSLCAASINKIDFMHRQTHLVAGQSFV